MAASGTAVFTDPADYRAGIDDANLDFVLTGRGDFRARLTWLKLRGLHLLRGREGVPRIAYVSMAPARAAFSFSVAADTQSVWNGVEVQFGDIVLHSGGERAHQWTLGASHWGLVSLRPGQLAYYCRALAEVDLSSPPAGLVLRPLAAAALELRRLHSKACTLVERKPDTFSRREAAHALEQEVVGALVACLTTVERNGRAPRPYHVDVMTRFENALRVDCEKQRTTPELCATIGVPERTLRECCLKFLGLSPGRYIRLRRLNMVRSALQQADPETASVSELAKRYGFTEMGRFAAAYRTVFGEVPSATLKNGHAPIAPA
jgi:AraC-like DNA-binding protein